MICGAMQRAYDAHGIACPPRETMLSIVGLSLRPAFETLGRGQEDFPVDGLRLILDRIGTVSRG